MRIIRDYQYVEPQDRGATVAIGNFDGVHLGHQAVIALARKAVPDAPLGVVTFEPHPRQYFAPDAPPFRLMSRAARATRLAKLGVEDELAEVPGVTTAMMVAFGENGIKSVEDLADCATDDLLGWTERKKEKGAEAIRHKGILDGFDVDRAGAEDLIMSARVHAGWIKPEDLAQPEVEAEADIGEDAAETEPGDGQAAAPGNA